MKKILVTGGSGFIGRNLCEQLGESYELYSPRHEELDLLDAEAVQTYLARNCFDVVIHAANRNDTRKRVSGQEVLQDNLRMFFHLERCKQWYGKLLYFGSGAEYDKRFAITDVVEEQLGATVPKDAYGFSKYVMAKCCEHSQNIYDLCLFGVYGKYEEWERRFISNAICRVLKGRDITLKQNVYFDYLWVDDLVRIVRWFIENKPEYHRYNVCRGKKIDLYSLALMVKKSLTSDCNIVVAQEGWKPEYTAGNERLLKETGDWRFTEFEEAIPQLSDFYKEHLNDIDEEKF